LADRTKKAAPSKTSVMDKLESMYVLRMILYISRMSPVTKSDIYNNVARHSRMPEKIGYLEEMGLVKIYHTGKTNSSVIVITDRGRAVADLITEIVDIIEEKVEISE